MQKMTYLSAYCAQIGGCIPVSPSTGVLYEQRHKAQIVTTPSSTAPCGNVLLPKRQARSEQTPDGF